MRSASAFGVLGIGLLSLAGGCAAPARVGPSPFERDSGRPAPIPEVTIDVTNDHWAPVRVWLERPDGRFFVGEVGPGEVDTFLVPGYLVTGLETLRLFAGATGTVDEVVSDPLDLRRGRHIDFRLRRVLLSSRARIM